MSGLCALPRLGAQSSDCAFKRPPLSHGSEQGVFEMDGNEVVDGLPD